MTPWELVLRAEQAVIEKRFADAVPDLRAALADESKLDADAYPSERGEYVPHPQAANAEMLLGIALHELGDRDEAPGHLDRAVALDRDDARVVANRGHVRAERGERELALADFGRALELRRDYGFARFRRAHCYAAMDRCA